MQRKMKLAAFYLWELNLMGFPYQGLTNF